MDDVDLQWPRLGNKVFRPGIGSDAQFNAALNWQEDNLPQYAHSYYRAACVLLAKAQGSFVPEPQLAQPICFLVRHFLELQLKLLIREARHALSLGPMQTIGHALTPLWDDLRVLLDRMPRHMEVEDYEALREQFVEFDTTDPQAVAFRYPTTKQGAHTLDNMDCINVNYLQDALERFRTFLKAIRADISRYARLSASRTRAARATS